MIGKKPDTTITLEDDPETADLSKTSTHVLLFGRPDISTRLPPAITARDVGQYAVWLRLEPLQRDALNAAHQRYLERLEQFRAEHKDKVREAGRTLQSGDGVEGYTQDNLAHYRDVEAAAMAQQRAVEEAFFVDVRDTLALSPENEAYERMTLARQRQWLNSGVYMSETRDPGGSWQSMIDVSFMLARMRDLDLLQHEVDAILIEYERALTPLLQDRQKAVSACAAVDAELRVEWQERRAESGEQYPDVSDVNEQRQPEALRSNAIKAGAAITELNARTIEQLANVMPVASAERVCRTFDRLCWPRIYADGSCAAPMIAGALKVADLTPRQRAEVEAIAAEYHPMYRDICERMVKSVEPADSNVGRGPVSEQEWKAANERRSVRVRMLFDRHELNVRVWQRLKGILTEDQAKAIGLGATPPEGPGEHDDFGT